MQSNGIEVKVDDVLTGFIRRAELARDKADQRPDRFAVGEKVDAKITAVDRAARKLTLTIKGKEMEEEKQAMAEFGSSDSGASLGDILGAAIRRRNQQAQQRELTNSPVRARGMPPWVRAVEMRSGEGERVALPEPSAPACRPIPLPGVCVASPAAEEVFVTAMSLETDLLLDRRRLKRRLFFWRSFAILAVLAAVLVALRGSGVGIERAHIARLAGQRHHHRGPEADPRGGQAG